MYFRKVTESAEKNSFRAEFEAHLNSPVPLLNRLRNFIFGKVAPDNYTKFSFYLALVIWAIFLLWSVLGYVAIHMRQIIADQKEIDVILMIERRGHELGFPADDFIGKLEAFHGMSIGFWAVAFIGLVLMWRKNLRFIYVFFPACLAYLIFMWSMLGFGYYTKDTTFFDKIAYAILVLHTAVYAYFLYREEKGIPLRLFGIDTDEPDENEDED